MTKLCLEMIGQLNAREEQMYSLVREIKTQNNQRFESSDPKFKNLVHLLQENNQAPQRMEEQEVAPKNERYNSVTRESLERQGSRRPIFQSNRCSEVKNFSLPTQSAYSVSLH